MSDTPTHDQLSALCAQLAATLQAITEMSGPMALAVAKAMAEIDLTAYRTLSPDPQWQRVPEECVVVPEEATPEMMDDAVKAARSAPPPLSDPAPGHRQIRAAYAAFLNRARGEG